MEALLARWAGSATERPVRALLLVALVTLACGWFAGGLELSTSRTTLVSEDDPHWRRYMAFAKEFGIPEDLVVVIEGADPDQVRAAADAVAGALDGLKKQVGSTFHKIDLTKFSSRAPLYLGYEQMELLERLARDPAIARLRTAPDAAGRVGAINDLLKAAPSMWSEGTVPPDIAALSAVLRGALVEMRRFALDHDDGGAPHMDAIDLSLLAEAVGDPLKGSGLDPSGYLTTDGGRTAVVMVRPRYHVDDIKVVEPFVAAVRAETARAVLPFAGVRFGLTGLPASAVDEQRAIEHDTRLTTLVALLGVIALFLIYFPSPRLLVLSLAPVLVGVVCTAAAARALYGYLNLISSVFLVILIGMGIDFSIHLGARFLELRTAGLLPVEAARQAVLKAGPGIVTGGLTSVGAFAAVGLSRFKAMAELGIVASIGLALTMVASLIVLPALLILFGPSSVRTRTGFPGLETAVHNIVRARVPLAALVAIASVPMAVLMMQSEFDYSLLNLLPEKAESARLMAAMVDKRELSANAAVAVADDLEAARAMEDAFRKKPTVLRAVSAASFLPKSQATRLHQLGSIVRVLRARRAEALTAEASPSGDLAGGLEELASRIERLQDLAFRRGDGTTVNHLEDGIEAVRAVIDALEAEEPETVRARVDAFTATLLVLVEDGVSRLESTVKQGAMSPADLPAGVRDRFVSASGRFAVYAFPRDSIWDRPALARFIHEARQVSEDVTGFPETFYENAGVMKQGFLEAALYASIAVVLLLMFDLRRPGHVLLSVLPLACGTLWMLGSMRIAGVRYNLANIVALPLIIGVGIDNAVHLLHRFQQDGDVHRTFVQTGGAVILSSLTTMIGFGSLALASHRGLKSLGEVLFIGVGCCLLATLLALPAGFAALRGRATEPLADAPKGTR